MELLLDLDLLLGYCLLVFVDELLRLEPQFALIHLTLVLPFIHDHLLTCLCFLNDLAAERDDDSVGFRVVIFFVLQSPHSSLDQIFLWKNTSLDEERIAILFRKCKELSAE